MKASRQNDEVNSLQILAQGKKRAKGEKLPNPSNLVLEKSRWFRKRM